MGKTIPLLTDRAYERIKHDIICCIIAPGTEISEAQLCAQYKLGKAPVRMALSRLAHDGLVRAIPRRGYMVTAITLKDIQDIFELRLMLEPAAARMAARSSSPGCQCSRRVQSGSRTAAFRTRYSYVRPVAEKRAWNESSAGSSSEIAMSSGRRALTPLSSSSAPRPLVVRRSMTCPLACTPASVLPAPVIRTGSPHITARTRSISPCTVGAFGWIWNPAYAVPSYATRAFQCFVSDAG